jgi:hypothetical protein
VLTASNTPSGTYTHYFNNYAGATPANCDTATATVVVSNPIDGAKRRTNNSCRTNTNDRSGNVNRMIR